MTLEQRSLITCPNITLSTLTAAVGYVFGNSVHFSHNCLGVL